MTASTDLARRGRALWAASEPFGLGLLFAPEGRELIAQRGVPVGSTYIAIRSAPLGRANAAVVAAAFHGFPVTMIENIVPGVWDRLSPRDVIDAHRGSLAATAERVFGDTVDTSQVTRFADLLTDLSQDLDTAGRPLAAGNQAQPAPDEPWSRLWHACTTLREYRGDTHVAVLTSAGLTVPESLVLTALWARDRIETDLLRKSRQLSDEKWLNAQAALVGRGMMTSTGKLTMEGVSFREDLETRTDHGSRIAWASLSRLDLVDTYEFLVRISSHMINTGVVRAITPVGAPWPPPILP